MTPDVASAATVALAAHRLTRLVVTDTVWAATRIRLRNWLRHHGPVVSHVVLADNQKVTGKRYAPRGFLPGKACDLLGCELCAGVWITAGVAAAWHYGGTRTRVAIRVAALAGAQSVLASRT